VEVLGVGTDRMAERRDVAAQDEVERFDLRGVCFARVEHCQGLEHLGARAEIRARSRCRGIRLDHTHALNQIGRGER
jgi:hypothetical protein